MTAARILATVISESLSLRDVEVRTFDYSTREVCKNIGASSELVDQCVEASDELAEMYDRLGSETVDGSAEIRLSYCEYGFEVEAPPSVAKIRAKL